MKVKIAVKEDKNITRWLYFKALNTVSGRLFKSVMDQCFAKKDGSVALLAQEQSEVNKPWSSVGLMADDSHSSKGDFLLPWRRPCSKLYKARVQLSLLG
jgi:hypothetical protein